MATVTRTTLTDDIDHSTDDVVTCAFGLGESQFEIDLNATHREELENALAKFVECARPVGGARTVRQRRQVLPAAPTNNREHTQAVRAWAEEQGLTVSRRGRISRQVQAAYDAAQ